ncbi:hypothetical protein [Streptomyces sp. NPDC054804]
MRADTGDGAMLLISAIIAAFCLGTVVCLALLGETSSTDLTGMSTDSSTPLPVNGQAEAAPTS